MKIRDVCLKIILILGLFFAGMFWLQNISFAKNISYLASVTDNKVELLSGMAQKLSVKVINESGVPIKNYPVNFKIVEGYAELSETRAVTNVAGIAETGLLTDESIETGIFVEVTSDVNSGSPLNFLVNAKKGTKEDRIVLERWRKANEKFIAAKRYFDNILTPLLQKASDKGMDILYPGVSYQVMEKFIGYAKDDLEYLQKVISGGRYKRLRLDYFERLETEVSYLERTGPAVKKEVEKIISLSGGGSPYANEPDFKNLRIENGNFYADNKPVFLIGPAYGNVELGELQKFGFNYYGVSMPPMNVILGATLDDYTKRKDEKFCFSETLTKFFKEAEEEDIMLTIYAPVSADYQNIPRWFYGKDFDINPAKKIDKIGCGSDHGMAFCMLNPCAKEMLEVYYKKIIGGLKGYPSILSYMVGGEIWYKCSPLCPLAEDDFRRWLSKKYSGNIKRLNINWGGTKYKAFGEIRLTDSCHWTKVQERYDYLEYNRWAVTEFFRWVSEIINEIDPKARVHFRLGGYFDHYYADKIDRRSGIDLETLNNEIFDIAEVAAPVEDWRHQVFNADLNQSLSPSRPGLDGEWAFLKRSDEGYDYDESKPYHISISPEKYVSSRLWEAFIHGKDAVGFFMWARGLEGKRWEVLSRPEELEALGRTALDIRRLSEYIVGFHTALSEAALLYSVTSKLQPNVTNYITELEKAYTGLFFLDTNINFVTEHQINQDKLDDYKLLIIPRTNYIKEDAYYKIRDFVYKGGTLFVTNESLLLNEYGVERDVFFSMKDKKIEKYGRGGIYYYNVNFSRTDERYYHEIFDNLFNLIGINRPIRVLDNEGHNYWGIEMRVVERKNDRIIYLLNLTNKPAKIKIAGISPENEIKDLISGRKIDVLSLTLKPLDVLLLMDARPVVN